MQTQLEYLLPPKNLIGSKPSKQVRNVDNLFHTEEIIPHVKLPDYSKLQNHIHLEVLKIFHTIGRVSFTLGTKRSLNWMSSVTYRS